MPVVLCVQVSKVGQAWYTGFLAPRGYELRSAGTGPAVRLLTLQQPDAVIVEAHLPDLRLLKLIQEMRREPEGDRLYIVATANNATEAQIIELLEAGADEYLSLPVSPPQLLAKLYMGLKRRHRATGLTTGEVHGADHAMLFARRFEILGELPPGGYSHVYQARDTTDVWPGLLAIKIFRPEVVQGWGGEYLPVVLSEAAKLAGLNHPSIVRFYDLGQTDEHRYLVTEFAVGTPLDRVIAARAPLPEAELIVAGYEIVSALEYLDSRRILHRDIKPGNLIMTEPTGVKLIDFGLARAYGERTEAERLDMFQGTAQYASPEQVSGGAELDIRSDIYALGVTLYYAATGAQPFEREDIYATLHAHFNYTPPPLQQVNPLISAKLSELISRMIAFAPDDRPTVAQCTLAFFELALATPACLPLLRGGEVLHPDPYAPATEPELADEPE